MSADDQQQPKTPNTSKPKKRKTYPLRLPPKLFQELQAWAEQEMRSVNGQIEFVLREALRKRKGRDESDAEAE